MSGKDDPFGSGGKTVIRPNPLAGRVRPERPARPMSDPRSRLSAPRNRRSPTPNPSGSRLPIAYGQPPRPPMAGSAGAPSNYGSPARPGYGAPQSPVHSPMPTHPDAARHGMPVGDDWMHSGKASVFFPDTAPKAPVAAPHEKIPLEVALNARDGGEYSASNPITAAAAPLLILLGRLRLMIVDMQAVPLMNHVAQEIRDFEKQAGEAGVSPEDSHGRQIRAVRHRRRHRPEPARHRPACLDAVRCWRSSSRCARRGVGFFEELKKILANPAPRYNLLELMHACLSLGFEGPVSRRGRRRQRVAALAARRLPDAALAPHAQRRRHLAALAAACKLMRDAGAQIPLWVDRRRRRRRAGRRLLPAALHHQRPTAMRSPRG